MTPQELKNSILQLAIQGKLVEQRPEEGTAEELFAQIQEEKQRLIREKKIKKQKPMPEITEDEKPFDIPESWKWIRLSQIWSILNGDRGKNYPAKSTLSKIGIPFISAINLNGKTVVEDENLLCLSQIQYDKLGNGKLQKNDVVVCIRGSLGKHGVYPFDQGAIASSLVILRNYFLNICDDEFLLLYLDSPLFFSEIKKYDNGTAQPNLAAKSLEQFLVPLPSLCEQKRIVAKIEELLPYIDRYEQAWSKLEQFNSRFPEDMKKSLLQYAIQGKLVEQRPEEGTAEELFVQIQEEKQRLIAEKKIKKEKPLPEITDDEKLFDIPDSWKWVRLIDVCKTIADGDHQAPPQVTSGIPFLVISNISKGNLDFSNTRYVTQEYFDSLAYERIAESNDILFSVTGSYGIPVIVDCEQKFCFQRHIALIKGMIDINYLYFLLESPVVKVQCDKVATGTAQKTVGLKSLKNLVVPLPPLAEQKRIVEKLEQLRPLCERLK